MRPAICACCLALMFPAVVGRGDTPYPRGNVVRGLYCGSRELLSTGAWGPWGSGFELDRAQAHGGNWSLKCTSADEKSSSGAGQTVKLDQAEARPILISGWSKCRRVKGERSYKYSLYVDLRYQDGESFPMQIATFSPGTHDWEHSEFLIRPKKPLASARFYAFIREQPGTVWFDDLFFGEPGGKNLLRDPGFEASEHPDTSERDKVLDTFADLNANAIHIYLNRGSLEPPNPPAKRRDAVADFLTAAHRRGFGVWVTMGAGGRPVSSADDPNFPEYFCVNGQWGRDWSELIAFAAQRPFDAVGFVPDEYNWSNGGLKRRYAKARDERVREFYAKLPAYCNCPDCRKKFEAMFDEPFPELPPGDPPGPDPIWLKFVQFRYASTTDWIRRTAEAVRRVNKDIRLDSMICVTPICSDRWLSPGVAWDQVGYRSGIDILQTDPYILLHNYLGDSTHWYVTETATHLVGANRKRRAGVTLEASRLRPSTEKAPYRNLDPVEVYGSAYSAVFRGAREVFWWHYSHLTGKSNALEKPEENYNLVKDCYAVLKSLDSFLPPQPRPQKIAVLHSRASEDLFSLYVKAPDSSGLTHKTEDRRYGYLAQKEVLYALFREGVPFDLYYLEQVTKEQLAPYQVLIVPFPFVVSEERVKLLEGLAAAGKKLLVISECGRCDGLGLPRPAGGLQSLVGLSGWPRGEKEGELTFEAGAGFLGGQTVGTLKAYGAVPVQGAEVWAKVAGTPAVLHRRVGAGEVVYVAGELGYGLPATRQNEKRTHAERILPPPLRSGHVRVLLSALDYLLGAPCSLFVRKPPGREVEVQVVWLPRGKALLLATNWENSPVSVEVRVPGMKRVRMSGQAQTPQGITPVSATEVSDAQRLVLALRPQEARLLRIEPSSAH